MILDEPRECLQYGPHCLAAYGLDPRGLKLEAVCESPEESEAGRFKGPSRTLVHAAVTPGSITLLAVRWLIRLPARFWRWLTDDTPPTVPDTYRVGDETEHPPWDPGDDFRVDGAGGIPPF